MTEITINLHDQPCGNCTVCIGRNIGAKHEQERIIQILTAKYSELANASRFADSNYYLQAIALIKGEN